MFEIECMWWRAVCGPWRAPGPLCSGTSTSDQVDFHASWKWRVELHVGWGRLCTMAWSTVDFECPPSPKLTYPLFLLVNTPISEVTVGTGTVVTHQSHTCCLLKGNPSTQLEGIVAQRWISVGNILRTIESMQWGCRATHEAPPTMQPSQQPITMTCRPQDYCSWLDVCFWLTGPRSHSSHPEEEQHGAEVGGRYILQRGWRAREGGRRGGGGGGVESLRAQEEEGRREELLGEIAPEGQPAVLIILDSVLMITLWDHLGTILMMQLACDWLIDWLIDWGFEGMTCSPKSSPSGVTVHGCLDHKLLDYEVFFNSQMQ